MAASNDSFHWLDVEHIGFLLAEAHPDRDPVGVGFVELKRLVTGLTGFKEEPGHPCNEKILETIQRFWIEEAMELKREDD